jgi:capsular polysaccharide transport system permease protein
MTSSLQGSSFIRSLSIQARVIGALLMRELITRYGRHNIGFMWVFVEPMMFTVGVLLLWTVFKTHTTKLPMVPFTIMGYATVLLWRNTINRCGNAIEPNRALLHHRNVRVLDLFSARLILEVAGASVSFITLLAVLIGVGAISMPDDIFKMITAWLLLAWFAMPMGLLVGSLIVVSETVERVWHVFTYLFLPVSGAFFMVDWIPKHLQALALLVPTIDGVELLREGYFGPYIHAHYDVPYLICVDATLTLMALFAIRLASRTVEGG